MTVLISGGTGFIGRHLCDFLEENNCECIVITRSPQKYSSSYPDRTFITLDDVYEWIEKADAVVNLAGENLFDQRWTSAVKQRIKDSRVRITSALTEVINQAEKKPDVFVSTSAVGFYGDQGERELSEEMGAGDDFLAEVCKEWEAEAQKVIDDVRLVIPRIGIVLHPDGGALEKFILPFKLFAGGPIGSGDQIVPWIHMDDVIRSIWFAITQEKCVGPYNCSAPKPVSMKRLTEAIGNAMNRPSWLPVPQFALDIALGEAAKGITASMNAKPFKLKEWDFHFRHGDLDPALDQLLV